jgi:hypothetical protein
MVIFSSVFESVIWVMSNEQKGNFAEGGKKKHAFTETNLISKR